MTTITFTQTTTPNGQIALTLSSADLPGGSFSFNIGFNYSGKDVVFSKVTYSGSSATSSTSTYVGTSGTVSINGTLSPTSGGAFAIIYFDALGSGLFNADLLSLKVNGSSANFVDPEPYSFKILGEIAAVQAGASATGSYTPIDSFPLTLDYKVKTAPAHGTLTFGDSATPGTWKYVPAAGFYGVDSFALRVSNGLDVKEKTVTVHVSPVGTPNNDTFHSSAANYQVDGGAGLDVLKYSGNAAGFTIAKTQTGFVVTDKAGLEGVNHLSNLERLAFADMNVALDIAGNGGQAYRIYQAAFNRTPDASGLGFWINAMDKGTSLTDVATGFMASQEFKQIYGAAPSNTQLVTKFYENILHRQPEQGGLDFWVGVLDGHGASAAQVLANISESAENQVGVATIIGNGFTYLPYGG